MNKHPHGFGWNGHQTFCGSLCWLPENTEPWRSSTDRSFDCPDYIMTGFTKGLNPLAHKLGTHQYESVFETSVHTDESLWNPYYLLALGCRTQVCAEAEQR